MYRHTHEEDFGKTYVLEQSRLEGTVRVSGFKNNVLRLMAASLLTSEPVHLRNYPASLMDLRIHADMLERLGKTVTVDEEREEAVIVETGNVGSELRWEGPSIRNTLLILGALVARTGFGAVPLPGGCKLGENRKFDVHELVLQRLGARVFAENGMLCAEAPDGLTGAEIELPMRSAGATENALMASSLARGITRIWNPNLQPEILWLVEFLRGMGAKIEVHGSSYFEVTGSEHLRGTAYEVRPDFYEPISWAVGALVTGGTVEVTGIPLRQVRLPLTFLQELGARIYMDADRLVAVGGECYPFELVSGHYPNILSDLQPFFAVYGACARGESRIYDHVFRGRYGYAAEMAKMGVGYRVEDNWLFLRGTPELKGATVEAVDLRSGCAVALMGFAAEGQTVIKNAWQIDRGYHRFEEKVKILGGKIRSTVHADLPAQAPVPSGDGESAAAVLG